MCFSPGVDLITGVAITVVGADALRHIESPRERPLAALPVVFGLHQVVEAVVWWGVEGKVGTRVGEWFAWLYLAVAFGLLPWFVPWAARRLEPQVMRRKLMTWLARLGGVVSAILMASVIRGPIVVAEGGHYLAYRVPLSYGGVLVGAYILATCGSLVLSSDRRVVLFGVVNLAAVIGLVVLVAEGVISLWCVWAAVTSVVIALHVRRSDPHGYRVQPIGAMR